jgi:hypothetical protein
VTLVAEMVWTPASLIEKLNSVHVNGTYRDHLQQALGCSAERAQELVNAAWEDHDRDQVPPEMWRQLRGGGYFTDAQLVALCNELNHGNNPLFRVLRSMGVTPGREENLRWAVRKALAVAVERRRIADEDVVRLTRALADTDEPRPLPRHEREPPV